MYHPFGDLIGLKFIAVKDGKSHCQLDIVEKHFNPNKVVHGAIPYALADTGMGAALMSQLRKDKTIEMKSIATVEIKINYFKSAKAGLLDCKTKIVNLGKTMAYLQSDVWQDETLIATATGTFYIRL